MVSLRSTAATLLQGPESFNSGAWLVGKCSVITFAVSSSALARAIPSLTISGGGKARARWGRGRLGCRVARRRCRSWCCRERRQGGRDLRQQFADSLRRQDADLLLHSADRDFRRQLATAAHRRLKPERAFPCRSQGSKT